MSYTGPVNNALNGARSNARNWEPCNPGQPRSWQRECKVPDLRPRRSDLRAMQEQGLLPNPFPNEHTHLGERVLNVKYETRGKTSGWLMFPVAAAQSTVPQSPADADEVNGQSRLRDLPSCHANPRAQELFNWLNKDKDPRFFMTLSPVFQQFRLPPLEGTVIILGVRRNSERFAGGVQELVDKINAIPCTQIPVVWLDLPVPGGKVNPSGVTKRTVDLEGYVTQAQIQEVADRVRAAVAEVDQAFCSSGIRSHVSPIPGDLEGQAYVDFHTKWAEGAADADVRGKLLAKIKTYAEAKKAYVAIHRQQIEQFLKVISRQMKAAETSKGVTLIPVSDALFNNVDMGPGGPWCKLREREMFEGPRN